MGLRLGDFYYIFKYVRRRMSQSDNTAADLWPCTVPLWKEWHTRLVSAVHYAYHQSTTDRKWTLFTDASDAGWGYVVITPDGQVNAHGEAWNTALLRSIPIHEREGKAVLLALEHIVSRDGLDFKPADTIYVRIDNTSIGSIFTKGRSPAYWSNLLATQFDTTTRFLHVHISYIASQNNPADPVSRAFGSEATRNSLQLLRAEQDFPTVVAGAWVHGRSLGEQSNHL